MRGLMALSIVVALSSPAWAAGPYPNIGQPSADYTRPGGPDWAGVLVITESEAAKSTFEELPVNFAAATDTTGRPGWNVPAVFGWNTRITVTASVGSPVMRQRMQGS